MLLSSPAVPALFEANTNFIFETRLGARSRTYHHFAEVHPVM